MAAEEEDIASTSSDLAPLLLNFNFRKLQRLQQNEGRDFCIRKYADAVDTGTFGDDHWDDWNLLFTELLKNTSVENVNVALQYCRPVESLDLFVKYIGTSPKLKNLVIHYDDDLQGYNAAAYKEEQQQQQQIPECYRSKIDNILLAVRQNPAIQTLKLHCLGNQQSMQHVLSGNTSLTTFELDLNNNHHVSETMATCIATGLQGNKALQDIVLTVCKGHLDIVLSGLCHRRRRRDNDDDDDADDDDSMLLQSLTISHRFEYPKHHHRNSQLGLRVFEAIQCNPSLKKLVIKSPSSSSLEDHGVFPRRSWVGDVLKKLHHTDCAGLEILQLDGIAIGTNQHDDDEENMMAADWIVPAEQANWTLKDLFLINVRFGTTLSARLLGNLRGIKRLYIHGMHYPHMDPVKRGANEQSSGEEGDYDEYTSMDYVESDANEESSGEGDDYDESDPDNDDDSDGEKDQGEFTSNLSGDMGGEEEGGNDENGHDEDEKDGANESVQGDEHSGAEEKQADIDKNNGSENDNQNDEADPVIQDNGNGGAKAKEAGVDENSGSGDHDDNVGTNQEQAQGTEIVGNVGAKEGNEVVDNRANAGATEPADYWAEFIRQCTKLGQVYISDVWYGVYASILRGARGHAHLQNLTLKSNISLSISKGELRSLLRQILQETTCLKGLYIENIGPHHDVATGLAEGLRENESLEKLDLYMPLTKAANFRTILESLFENDTLHRFDLCTSSDIPIFMSDSHEICEALSHLFRVNRSLFHIGLPTLDLRGRLHGLLEGLGQSTTLKSLDLKCCLTNAAGFRQLRESLVDEHSNIPLEHIGLPSCPLNEATGLSLSDVQDFFRKTVRMRGMKTVDFGGHRAYLEGENCLKFLLHAVKENKTLFSFGTSLNHLDVPIVSEIKYYLKLNRFGRRALDSTNLLPCHWPAILAPMAGKSEDADALFFFIREYFMRYSYPLRHQHQRQEPRAPPPKRARVDESV